MGNWIEKGGEEVWNTRRFEEESKEVFERKKEKVKTKREKKFDRNNTS